MVRQDSRLGQAKSSRAVIGRRPAFHISGRAYLVARGVWRLKSSVFLLVFGIEALQKRH